MIRALIFVALLAVVAGAAAWLADRPGEVEIVWLGHRISTSVAVALVGVAALAFAIMATWTVIRFMLKLPDLITLTSRARRRTRGFAAVSRGMVAIGAGDPAAARRYAGDAQRLLGNEPLALLLSAQAAQISGDRAGAEAAFNTMLDDSETQVLGLRGLFIEARRKGDAAAARVYAAKAAQVAPAVGWANEAVLEYQSISRDWRGALMTLERRASLKLVDDATARRQRAVLLTADAIDRAEPEPQAALPAAREAARLAPDLVPAGVLAAKLTARDGNLRKAARILEAGWRAMPHPDLALAYVDLRAGDSGRDRLRRAERLLALNPGHEESYLAVARAALDAREFGRAREALKPLLALRPSVRVCLLMADIEEAEHGETGTVREWLSRASRAPRDPAWIADGVVAERWAPVSPVSGRLDAFVWATPQDRIAGPSGMEAERAADDVADMDEARAVEAQPVDLPREAPPEASRSLDMAGAEKTATEEADKNEADKNAAGKKSDAGRAMPPTPVIFPMPRAPDDPGPRPPTQDDRSRQFG
jgi:HemY protein